MALKVQPPKTQDELREERKENLIALALAIIVIGVIAFFIWRSVTAPPPAAQERVNLPLGNAPVLGSPNASVTVVIFSDFECPYCGEFALETFPTIRSRLVDTGQVRVAFRHFPLGTHPYANRAAQASACAHDQNTFWEYHDVLFANQEALQIGDLQSYARDLGLDMTQFDTCLLNEERAKDVAQDRALGLAAGVTGTPTFFFNGRKVAGALTASEFTLYVEQELGVTS